MRNLSWVIITFWSSCRHLAVNSVPYIQSKGQFCSKPKQGGKKMKQTFKFTRYIVVMVMVGLMLGSDLPMATASKNVPVQMVPQNFSTLADTVSPAVVHIRVVKTVKGRGPVFHQFCSWGKYSCHGDLWT